MAKVYKNAHIEAAKIASNDPQMEARAKRVHGIARAEAAKHIDSGDYYNSIKIKRGRGRVKDWIIYSDDPLALSKEFGHAGPDKIWIEGVHAFGKALGEG